MTKKIRFFWTTILAFLIILTVLTVFISTPSEYNILRVGLGICCLLLLPIVTSRLRKKRSIGKATVALLKKEEGGVTWCGISINGSKPKDDEWFFADGRVTIQDVICKNGRISYRIFIYHKDGTLKTVIEKKHDLVSI